MCTQRSKLVHAEIIALVQTDDIGRLNYVQLPKIEKRMFSKFVATKHPWEKGMQVWTKNVIQ